MIHDIADMDCVYLTYNEPKKEEFWAKIQNMIPWAVRVDGVKGSDAAHKAAADASTTERFILIDGDNIPEERFFDLQLDIPDHMKDCVFRWRAWNAVNGLAYGNGGLSCWTREFIRNMRTHEASDGSADTAVEFCYDSKYLSMHNVYSTTYPNGSAQQAFIAGFREGVKLCLDRGEKIPAQEFHDRVHPLNLNRLKVWLSVGADVKNGAFARSGALYGVNLLYSSWDYQEVQDFDKLTQIADYYFDKGRNDANWYDELVRKLNIDIVPYTSTQSELFKESMRAQYIEFDPMTLEQGKKY